MTKPKFKKGDRVVLAQDPTNADRRHDLHVGDEGVVVSSLSGRVGVRWDKRLESNGFAGSGHTCNGKCENYHGWYVNADCLDNADKPISLDLSFLY